MPKECTICRTDDADQLYRHRYLRVLRCRRCGLVYVDSHIPPSEQERLGAQAIQEGPSYAARVYEARRDLWLSYYAGKLNQIQELQPVGRFSAATITRLLEVACFTPLRVALEDNLEMLRARAAPQGITGLVWYATAWVVHQLARASHSQNQLIVYSRQASRSGRPSA